MTNHSIQKVAVWLINRIQEEKKLKRSQAITEAEVHFGNRFIEINNRGDQIFIRPVMNTFRELKDPGITWDSDHQSWIAKNNAGSKQKFSAGRPDLPRAVQVQEVPDTGQIDHPALYLNKELGWLDFNWRVLYQAMDLRNPLLERLRFVAITASNLDEFIQKRVGGLKRQEVAGVFGLSPDGRTPEKQIQLVQKHAAIMQEKISGVWNQTLRTAIEEEASIKISSYDSLKKQQKKKLNDYFDDHIYPTLTPLAVDPGHPFPFISNLSLSLAIKLKKPDRDAFNFARLKIPTNQQRWFPLESTEAVFHYVPMEEIIRRNIHKLFPGMLIESTCLFRITRNADLRRNEEEAEDLLSLISEELRERRFAEIVRMEIERNVDPEVLNLLKNELQLGHGDIIMVDGLLDLTDLYHIADKNLPGLRYEEWNPVIPEPLYREGTTKTEQTIFDIIRKGDLLVHHPYESFAASVRRLIDEAADDPDVLAIKQTLYRTSENSPIVKALIRAAEKDKQVAVLVEVKARFDEASNIEWGKMLENAGVHVAYGLVGLKTHAKVALIVRREGDQHMTYCHIGTGNYHIHTAEVYADLGVLTSDADIGYDITNLFHFLTGYAPNQQYRKLRVAPNDLRKDFYALIEKEIRITEGGGTGRIIAKMNALDDVGIIKKLYSASQAGVTIDLIVRGHTRLRPQLPGYSDNIRVISIIGRFLEHDRVYFFGNDGNPDIFIGSGDWRYRNLNERVEVLLPVTLNKLKKRITSNLEKALGDNRLAWEMKSDGSYQLRIPKKGEQERNFQSMMMDDARKHMKSKKS